MQLDEFCRQQNQLKKFLPYLHRAALHPLPKPCQHRWLRGSLKSWIAGITERKSASSRGFGARAVADHQLPVYPPFLPQIDGESPHRFAWGCSSGEYNSLGLRRSTEQRAKAVGTPAERGRTHWVINKRHSGERLGNSDVFTY